MPTSGFKGQTERQSNETGYNGGNPPFGQKTKTDPLYGGGPLFRFCCDRKKVGRDGVKL